MEFLRDEDIGKFESVTETSEDKPIIDSGAQTESGDPSVELETPEAWPDHQDKNNKETNGKRLRWLHVIGKDRYITKIFSIQISEKKVLPFAVLLLGGIYAAVAAIFYFQ